MQEQGYGRPRAASAEPPADATVIRGRNTGAVVIFGGLTLLFFLVLAVSEGSQETTGGRIAAAVFFGAFGLGSLAGLVAALVRTSRLEIGRISDNHCVFTGLQRHRWEGEPDPFRKP